jgi:hypothetical protein
MIPRESEDLSSSDATTTESDSDDTSEETSNWYHWEHKDFYIFYEHSFKIKKTLCLQ